MTTIIDVTARQILDSRGNPTVEVEVELESRRRRPRRRALRRLHRRARGRGAARRRQEELPRQGRAQGRRQRQQPIAEEIVGIDATDQRRLDRMLIELDGTPNKAKLGANAILGVSLAVRQAAARRSNCRSTGTSAAPTPHAAGAHDEHPQRRQARRQQRRLPGVHDHAGRAPGASRRACAWAPRSSTRSRRCSRRSGYSTAVGDEGGFAPNLEATRRPSRSSCEAIEKAGYKPGERRLHRPRPGGDRASTTPRSKTATLLKSEGRELTTATRWSSFYAELVEQVPHRLASRTAWPRTTGTAGKL